MRIVDPAPAKSSKPTSQNQDALDSFLGISYKDPLALEKSRQQLTGRNYPRKQLAEILREYNASIDNDAAAQKQINALEKSASTCVVTGQQLGLMGGPAYTILKGITCLLTAREAGAVPIFWLATEDHDIAEIDHTYLLDALGNLQRFHFALPKDGRPVEDLEISPKNHEVLKQFLQAAGMQEETPVVNHFYAQTMARFMVRAFAGTGMVFLEPRLLRPLAKDFWRLELEKSAQIQEVLQETNKRLTAAGGHPILSFEAGTNLFLKVDGYRRRLIRQEQDFLVGEEHYTLQKLLDIVEKQPERLSTNVAARPVLQSTLLPTVAYIAGPAEMEYHRQLGDYHQLHNVPMPCIVPRLSASFIPSQAAGILEKCELQPWEEIPHHWKELMPALKGDGEAMEQDWLRSAVRYFSDDVSDEVLLRYIRLAERKLMRKVTKVRLQKQQIPSHGLHLLRNLLHPHDKLQERVLNWWGFQKHSEANLVDECFKHLKWKSEGHQYIYL